MRNTHDIDNALISSQLTPAIESETDLISLEIGRERLVVSSSNLRQRSAMLANLVEDWKEAGYFSFSLTETYARPTGINLKFDLDRLFASYLKFGKVDFQQLKSATDYINLFRCAGFLDSNDFETIVLKQLEIYLLSLSQNQLENIFYYLHDGTKKQVTDGNKFADYSTGINLLLEACINIATKFTWTNREALTHPFLIAASGRPWTQEMKASHWLYMSCFNDRSEVHKEIEALVSKLKPRIYVSRNRYKRVLDLFKATQQLVALAPEGRKYFIYNEAIRNHFTWYDKIWAKSSSSNGPTLKLINRLHQCNDPTLALIFTPILMSVAQLGMDRREVLYASWKDIKGVERSIDAITQDFRDLMDIYQHWLDPKTWPGKHDVKYLTGIFVGICERSGLPDILPQPMALYKKYINGFNKIRDLLFNRVPNIIYNNVTGFTLKNGDSLDSITMLMKEVQELAARSLQEVCRLQAEENMSGAEHVFYYAFTDWDSMYVHEAIHALVLTSNWLKQTPSPLPATEIKNNGVRALLALVNSEGAKLQISPHNLRTNQFYIMIEKETPETIANLQIVIKEFSALLSGNTIYFQLDPELHEETFNEVTSDCVEYRQSARVRS